MTFVPANGLIGVNIKCPDGHSHGVVVTSADTGCEINGISRLSLTFEPDNFARVEAELFASDVEIEGALAEFYIVDPSSGDLKPVQSIQFADGTSWPPSDQC